MRYSIQAITAAMLVAVGASRAAGALTATRDGDGIGARAGETAFFWRTSPASLTGELAGFSTSGYFQSLRTPAGFELLCVHPADHPHHCGLWWPWKFIEVDGGKYNTWEVQEGQGAHIAKAAEPGGAGKDGLSWRLACESVIKPAGRQVSAAIAEDTTLIVSDVAADTRVFDIEIRQKAVAAPVRIINYRYSGFSWRGPASWNKDNSTMTTSGGKDRDHANGTSARWVVVSGATPTGMASMLLLSAAVEIAGAEESLRVWDSKAMNGTPFVNFNPVMGKALPLDAEHPAVSHRKYRVIAADRVIDAAAAEAEWRKWMAK